MWEILTAVGSFGQFVIVTAAACFGYAQLRQLHRQNELQATIPYFATTRTAEFNYAIKLVRAEIAADGKTDPSLRAAIAAADLEDERVYALYNCASFFNELGVLVQESMIDEELVLSFFQWPIKATWELFSPFIAHRRNAGVDAMMVSFESLAVRAREYSAENRIERARRRLPPALRADFDRSVNAMRSHAP